MIFRILSFYMVRLFRNLRLKNFQSWYSLLLRFYKLQAQQLGQDVDMQAVMNQVTGAAANGKKFFPKKFGGIVS